jgi:deoxyinosine 3'endonuclease (endonuclease V)
VRLIRQQMLTHPNLTPRAILVDGNGILHTRKAGLACFLGVRTGIPTIGIGKTLFCEAGLTKELVSRAVCASLVAAVQHCNPEKREGGTCETDPVLLVDRHVVRPNLDYCIPLEERVDREALVHELSQICWGLAVPLGEQASRDGNELDSTRKSSGILACALIAHGGRVVGTRKAHRMGSQNPIYVSVGHCMTPVDAVAICASQSLARIPEPVRQADLIGRQLLRQAATSHTNTLSLENKGNCYSSVSRAYPFRSVGHPFTIFLYNETLQLLRHFCKRRERLLHMNCQRLQPRLDQTGRRICLGHCHDKAINSGTGCDTHKSEIHFYQQALHEALGSMHHSIRRGKFFSQAMVIQRNVGHQRPKGFGILLDSLGARTK